MVQFELEGRCPPPMPERDFSWPVYDIFDTADGRQVFVAAVTEGQWAALCKLLGLQELLADPRLRKRMDQIEARSWTLPIIARALKARESGALLAAFEQLGIPYSPIARPSDMYQDPHVMRPGGLATSHLPDGTSFRAPALPFEVDGSMLAGGGDLAAVGQDTVEVLASLGLDEAEIAAAAGSGKEQAA
jgi:crotonobetainyl-CoA:carnitine CoA-transferase CaiB-like acyl-CoA transferase